MEPRFSLPSGKAPYHPIHTGPAAERYTDRPLPDGIAKIDCRWSISTVSGRLREKSTVDGRLKKKKGRRRRGEEIPGAVLACVPPVGRPRAIAAHGRLLSPRGEMKRLSARRDVSRAVLTCVPPMGRSRAIAAHGRLLSPRGETKRLSALGERPRR
ncbi:hypothetical protein BHE74_00010599, partial [Ensete ventricosum]